MRVLSTLEKKIIDRICEGQTHISTLLIDNIFGLLIFTNRDENEISLRIKNEGNSDTITNTAIKQTERIIYIIKFLLYLEEEGYILTGHFAHGYNISGSLWEKDTLNSYDKNPQNFVGWPFSDDRTKEFIYNYIDLTIFPIHQLIAFKENGYKTEEERRHRQMVGLTRFAIGVSLILGIMSIYISCNK